MPLILALDQGTTSSRAILFDELGGIRGISQRELPQFYPRPGWVEHDPADIWSTQLATAQEVMAQARVTARDIACIGITNQRETAILWERSTGRPLHHAIVWQDRRTADFCSALQREGRSPAIHQKTGLVIDAYFSASKLRWLLDNIPDARERAARGELAFGTVDTWLLWNLTRESGTPIHATDISNASRTMLVDLHTGTWDDGLLALFDIPRELLPQILPSNARFGETRALGSAAIPIHGIAGDQQAALFGQNCLSPGLTKNTYGTGCFMLLNVGDTPALSRHHLLTTIAWQLQNSKTTYAIEGSVFVGGAVVQWLRDGLGLIKTAADVETLAASVPDNGGIYMVPAFAGLGAPHWDQYARGIIAGITRGTTAGHFARAAVESIAFQVADLLDVMHKDAGTEIPELRVDGGASRNNVLLQFQADLLRIPVARPAITETTAHGAALLAAIGAGVYRSTSELKSLWKSEARFEPRMSVDEALSRRERWNTALSRARDWESPTHIP